MPSSQSEGSRPRTRRIAAASRSLSPWVRTSSSVMTGVAATLFLLASAEAAQEVAEEALHGAGRLVEQALGFARVEPDAPAIAAAVDGHAMILLGLEVTAARGAAAEVRLPLVGIL